MFLATNEILKEKSRFVLITIAIALMSYLTFFLTALAYGLATSYTQAIDGWDASGIILSKDANNTVARSLLVKQDYHNIASDDAAPLGVGAATVRGDTSEDVALFGISTQSFLRPEVTSGRMMKADNEVVVSDALVKIGIRINDTLELQGSTAHYKIVGFTKKATFQTAPVVYMTLPTWRTAASETSGMKAMRDNTTISAIITRGGKKPAYTTSRIDWQPIRHFIFTLPGYRAQVLTFSVMIGFLVVIAAFVLAIFMYILTLQKKSVFGVLKAEGMSSGYIGRSVMAQVMLLLLSGVMTGLAAALITGCLLAGKVPFDVNPFFFLGIIVLFALCAVLGGLASVRSVVKIDPAEAIA